MSILQKCEKCGRKGRYAKKESDKICAACVASNGGQTSGDED